MVTPLAIFAAFLATGFLLPLADKLGRRVSATLFWALLAGFAGLAAYYLASFAAAPGTLEIYTGGFEPPLVIALRLGLEESAALAAIAAVALLAAFSMRKALFAAPVSGMMTFLMLVMGLSGLVLTRDLFNLFVFLEISGIAGYALLGFDDRRLAMSAAFKYMVAGGIASAAYLVGVIYLYRLTGTLNLDLMIGSAGLEGAAGAAAVFFVLAALLVELKPFPANGWAIDAYEAANPGLGAMFSGAQATAMLFALYKIFPLLSDAHLSVVMWAGIVTFAGSNLVGLRQKATRRMFGYSSAGQVGFVAAALAFGARYVEGSDFALLVAGG
ncbi:MAG TPA: proton-conducting transporter membrane subunit, partial [Spirochaetales bacterium]|nr:proton-conducting transporter membrane subunit [Spirochaetales bacterium]